MVDVLALTRELGFHRAAIVPVEAPRRHALYEAWLAAGHAGEMAYLASPEHVTARADLRELLGEARTLVVVALAYDRADPAGALLAGKIARYARGWDYHLILRDKLVELARRIADALGRPVASRPCIDSAPVLERDWAERGGLGFVAKNTMLIAPGLGSYVVLGELLLDVELPPTAPLERPRQRCGECRACLDACPTGAFVDEHVLDARRCISYLTIEFHGVIPRELRAPIGTWIFGCDVCQEVCPFNAGHGVPPAPELAARPAPDLIELARAPANQLRRFVRRTALRRVPKDVLLRNVAIALGNAGAPEAIPALVELLARGRPLVRRHAAWALGRLGARAAHEAHADDDPDVRAEIADALATLRGT